LPIGRGTMLDEVVDRLASIGEVRKRILVTNHRFVEPFRDWQRRSGAAVEILDDGTESPQTRLGAIRDVELASRSAGSGDDLLVVGTDNLFRWPLAAFVAQAQRFLPHPTVALWEAPSPEAATQFGVVVRDAAGRLRAFAEKSAQPPSREVALCVYYFPAAMRGMFQRFFDEGGNPDAPGYFIEWLVRTSAVFGVMMPGEWHDIGTPEEYETVKRSWRSA